MQSAIKKFIRALASVYHSLYFPPVVIVVAILAGTLFGWQAARQTLQTDITMAAHARAEVAVQSLREHMVAYEQIMRGSIGLFQSSEQVTLTEWQQFINTFNIDERYAGVRGIGFVQILKTEELPAVAQFMAGQGVNDFKIIPEEPTREEYAATLYIHSLESQAGPMYGYDMYTDPLRRQTMLRARDTGDIAMTPRVELIADQHRDRFGFGLFAPHYNNALPHATLAERQAALEGYVFASFRNNVFFKNIIGADKLGDNMAFYVAARYKGEGQAMYKSPTYDRLSQGPHTTSVTHQIELYGQTWDLRFVFDTHKLVSRVQLSRPSGVVFFGVFSALLIATIVFLLIRARSHDLNAQKERAVELAKDELLSLASHQLRTPATGVKQYLGMVLQGFAGRVPASQKNLLEKAYNSNDRQLRIINEILHLAKIESGRIVLTKQETNLNELVADIVNEQRADIEAARHTIQVKLPKKPLRTKADTHMLRMAVENLLSNAIKYTPTNGRIVVKAEKEGAQAKISIIDNGIGIQSEDLGKIFRQFSRLSNEMSQQVGGTGVGLYLAKHLVELHQGTVDVVSEPGKGSTFTISLPLKQLPTRHR
jgi:signal transduction histidine kinase